VIEDVVGRMDLKVPEAGTSPTAVTQGDLY